MSTNWKDMTFTEAVHASILADRERLREKFNQDEQSDPYISALDDLKRRGLSEIDALKVIAAALAESRKTLDNFIAKVSV